MDDALVEKVACAIYHEDTLAGLGKDVADRMRDRARAVLAIPDLRLAGVKEGLEMAAKVAEDQVILAVSGRDLTGFAPNNRTAHNIATAIRSLGPRP